MSFPIVCANGCPDGYRGSHKFSCPEARAQTASAQAPEQSPAVNVYAAGQRAVIEQRRTGYYITQSDGNIYADAEGHTWFSQGLARDIRRAINGTWFEQGNRTTIKDVVVRYEEKS